MKNMIYIVTISYEFIEINCIHNVIIPFYIISYIKCYYFNTYERINISYEIKYVIIVYL